MRVELPILIAGLLTFLPTALGYESSSSAPIVIGFLGGRVSHTDAVHGEVQLANRLERECASNVRIRTFENRHGGQAHREILQMLDRNGDGQLSSDEKAAARITIYGHSWGASETVTLARALGQDGIPVLLTIQVDSVAKLGEDDGRIPVNVAQAVNFFQTDGLLHGRSQIRADDPARTRILGNFHIQYKGHPVDCSAYPWFARLFMRPHIEIESDPDVWRQVESLIRANL
jgi:hypothetical protein